MRFVLSPGGQHLGLQVAERGPGNSWLRYMDVWQVRKRQRLARFQEKSESAPVTFDPTGNLLFVVDGAEVRVWDFVNGHFKVKLNQESVVKAVRISTASTVMATLGGGRVNVWDYATGEHLSQLADTAYVRDVRFSTNGQYLMTGSDDGAAVLWLWKTEDLRAQACERVGRNLTPAEWQRFLGAMPYSATCSGLP